MFAKILVGRVALLGAALAIASCADGATAPSASTIAADHSGHGGGGDGDHRGSALFFNGVDANTSSNAGTILTTQIDNISYDVMVRFDGSNSIVGHQGVFYNGHGAVTGWGILVIGPADGVTEGTLAILAGGIVVAPTPFVLTPGKWQRVRAERVAGNVTISLDGVTFNLGFIPVNPVGGSAYAGIERISVGGDGLFNAPTGDFHGAIDNLVVRDLANHKLIERWRFNEGTGSTTTGVRGTVLFLGSTTWIRHGGDRDRDDDGDRGDDDDHGSGEHGDH